MPGAARGTTDVVNALPAGAAVEDDLVEFRSRSAFNDSGSPFLFAVPAMPRCVVRGRPDALRPLLAEHVAAKTDVTIEPDHDGMRSTSAGRLIEDARMGCASRGGPGGRAGNTHSVGGM